MSSENQYEKFIANIKKSYKATVSFIKWAWNTPVVRGIIAVLRFIGKAFYMSTVFIAVVIVWWRQLSPRQKYDTIVGLLIIGAMINCFIIIMTS